MKKSFVLYYDYAEKFKSLSDEQFGKLTRCMIAYENTGETIPIEDIIVQMAFDVVKVDLDRNRKKYESICKRNRENGQKGGRPKETQNNPNNPVGFLETQNNPNNPVGPDNDNDNDIDKDNDTKEKIYPTDIQKRKAPPKEKPVYYPNDEKLNKAFEDFLIHRKQIKKPMSDRAITLAINKLEELSEGDNDKAIEIINQSILNGWQGIFELKEKTTPINTHQAYVDKWRDA